MWTVACNLLMGAVYVAYGAIVGIKNASDAVAQLCPGVSRSCPALGVRLVDLCSVFKEANNNLVEALVCGQLKWAMELKAKMSFSVKRFKELNHPVSVS